MAFAFLTLLWAGVTVLQTLLNRPRAPRPQSVSPEEFTGITAEEGRPVPIVFGTRAINNANVVWFGDLASTAIVQAGVTTGYQYKMGAQYVICVGPIDAVVDLRFNEKIIGASLDSGSNGIVFAASGVAPWKTATVAAGSYSNGGDLGAAIEAAMIAAEPGDWRVGHGFTVLPGITDTLRVRLEPGLTPVTVSLTPGIYSAAAFAAHVASRLNAVAGGADMLWGCGYAANRFTISFTAAFPAAPTWTGWTLMTSNAKFLLGFRHNIEHSAMLPGAISVTSDYDVLENRFIFSYGGTTAALHCTDAGFTAAGPLGISTAADKVGLGIATSDSDFVVTSATYTDMGDYLQADLNDSSFFGTEGGVNGRIEIYYGSPTQAASAYLATKFGGAAPAYRSVCYAVQRGAVSGGMYVGNTNTPKPIAFTVRRCPNQLGLSGGAHLLGGGDANPACILWEVLTDTLWGLGLPAAQLDRAAFQAAGASLAAEALGLSLILDAVTTAADFVEEVLRHVDGVLYVDQLTGLISMRLIRNDYVLADLPLVTTDNARSCKLTRASWEESRNAVRVHFIDRSQGYTERVEQLQDLANILSRDGDMATEDLQFPGISSQGNAALIAARELRTLSQLPAHIELEGVNRELWALRPGSPFRLTWAPLGITDMPCRVAVLSPGALDDGEIRIDAVQDIAGPPWTGFVQPTEDAPDPEEPVALPDSGSLEDSVQFGEMPMQSQ